MAVLPRFVGRPDCATVAGTDMWRLLFGWFRSASRRATGAGAPLIGFGLAAFLVCGLSPPAWGAESEAAGSAQFLMISDLHFDPMADPKLVNRLAAAGLTTMFPEVAEVKAPLVKAMVMVVAT